jgi:hypothetical protein
VSDPPVHLVLDASAVGAYPNIHLGETLTQVAENGGAFVTPLRCIVEARSRRHVRRTLRPAPNRADRRLPPRDR